MNLRKFAIPLLTAILATGLFSCSKDDDNNAASLNELFSRIKTAPTTYTVEAGTTDTLTAAGGTKVIFHPGSFTDASGNPITSGSITIELTEIYKPGQMILNRVNTVTTAGDLLTSGGQVFIKASRGGNEVKASSYGLAFAQSAMREDPMALFYGGPDESLNGTITWGTDTSLNIKGTNNINNEYFFLFDEVTDFGWINCDFFIDDPRPRTNISLTLSSSFSNENTQVFIVLPDYNSVMSPRNYNTGTRVFSLGSEENYYLPIGIEAKIVTLATVGSRYYLEIQDGVTITENLSLPLTPVEKSESAVISALEAL